MSISHHSHAALHTLKRPHHGLLDCRHTSTPAEVLFLYGEQQQYLQHGVQLQPNDTVIDIGANIGLFSMLAAEVLSLCQAHPC